MRSGPAMITTLTMSVPMMLFLIDCVMLLTFVDWIKCEVVK